MNKANEIYRNIGKVPLMLILGFAAVYVAIILQLTNHKVLKKEDPKSPFIQKGVIPPIWAEDKPTYIEPYGKWGFQYPKEYLVGGVRYNYVFPKSSLEDTPDLKISDGLVLSFDEYGYTDGFSLHFTEDTKQDFEYELWNGKDYDTYSADIYSNQYTGYLALQGIIPKNLVNNNNRYLDEKGGHVYGKSMTFSISFQDVSQLEDVKSILKTFISNKNYTLEVGSDDYYMYKSIRYPNLSAQIPDNWKYYDNKKIPYTFYYPPSIQIDSVEEPKNNLWDSSYRVTDSRGILSFNTNPELIGFSSSGALCANTRCYTIALYGLPGSKKILSIAYIPETKELRTYVDSSDLSFTLSVPSDKSHLLDEYVTIIQSIKMPPTWKHPSWNSE